MGKQDDARGKEFTLALFLHLAQRRLPLSSRRLFIHHHSLSRRGGFVTNSAARKSIRKADNVFYHVARAGVRSHTQQVLRSAVPGKFLSSEANQARRRVWPQPCIYEMISAKEGSSREGLREVRGKGSFFVLLIAILVYVCMYFYGCLYMYVLVCIPVCL